MSDLLDQTSSIQLTNKVINKAKAAFVSALNGDKKETNKKRSLNQVSR